MIPQNKQLWSASIWGLLQILSLVIGISDFTLWPHHPFPHESLSLAVMVCGQALFFALLASALDLDRTGLLIAIALMLPLDEFAGMLSNSPQVNIIKGFTSVSLWMVGLVGWTRYRRDRAVIPVVSAIAGLATAGGAILDYLLAEHQAARGIANSGPPLSPLPNLCLLIEHGSARGWAELSLPAALLAIAAIIRKLASKSSG